MLNDEQIAENLTLYTVFRALLTKTWIKNQWEFSKMSTFIFQQCQGVKTSIKLSNAVPCKKKILNNFHRTIGSRMKISYFLYVILWLHRARHINDDRVVEFTECYSLKSIYNNIAYREREIVSEMVLCTVQSGNSMPIE